MSTALHKQIVLRTHKLLSCREKWCRSHTAWDGKRQVSATSPDAIKWCWSGALLKSVKDVRGRPNFKVYVEIIKELSGEKKRHLAANWVQAVNDVHGYRMMMAVMERYLRQEWPYPRQHRTSSEPCTPESTIRKERGND